MEAERRVGGLLFFFWGDSEHRSDIIWLAFQHNHSVF